MFAKPRGACMPRNGAHLFCLLNINSDLFCCILGNWLCWVWTSDVTTVHFFKGDLEREVPLYLKLEGVRFKNKSALQGEVFWQGSDIFSCIVWTVFFCRAAMKMANMDAVLDFMFTNPRDEHGVSSSSSSAHWMLAGNVTNYVVAAISAKPWGACVLRNIAQFFCLLNIDSDQFCCILGSWLCWV